MATIIPRQPTGLEALSQALGLAMPGMVQGAQQRTLADFMQQQGLDLPPGLPPQLAQTIALQQLQQSLAPQQPFTLGPGQQRFDPTGQPIAGVPETVSPEAGFTLGQGQQRFGPAGQPIAGIPEAAPAGFTLGPGQQRFGPSGQPIAEIPATTRARAGQLQVAGKDDITGLPEGTVFQSGPQGNINVISAPEKPKPPTTKVIGDELYQWNPKAKKWESTGVKAPPPPAKEPFTPARVRETEGTLLTGGEKNIWGTVIPFAKRQDAINYARRRLGPNWSTLSPKSKRIIEKRWPEKGGRKKTKSPYKDYPDAYLEGGVWKVRRKGKVYRVEE